MAEFCDSFFYISPDFFDLPPNITGFNDEFRKISEIPTTLARYIAGVTPNAVVKNATVIYGK